MCLHSHSFPSTHGFMSEHSPVDLWPIQAPKHTQGHTIWLMECIHKDPPMHTHICLNKGFGLGNSFSRNKNKCQKEKKNQTNKPEHGELHKQKRARTYTHTVEAVSQSGLSSQLQLSACWVCFPWVQTSGEPHRFQAYVSMAAGQTDLCQESPSSLLTDLSLQEQHVPRSYHKHSSASKELSRNVFPAPDQSKRLLFMELIGTSGFIVSSLFRPQVSRNKTRQCTETQGRVCSNPRTARKQQAPEETGEVCLINCPSLLGKMTTVRPRWAATSKAHFLQE